MFRLMFLVVLSVPLVLAQEIETDQQDNKSQCVKDMVQWCNNMQNPENNSGAMVMSLGYHDSSTHYRVLCVSDSEGTNCSRNGSPWFTCTPDHTFTYKGQPLTESSGDVDDDICSTRNKAFNELNIQSMFSSRGIQKNFQSFFDEMMAMQAQLAELRRRMWSSFGGGFPFPTFDSAEPGDTEIIEKGDSNQVERE